MSNKILKVTVIVLAAVLILVEAAPRWQLMAANDDDITTTEISVDNGTDDVIDDPEENVTEPTAKPDKVTKIPQKHPGANSSSVSKSGKSVQSPELCI